MDELGSEPRGVEPGLDESIDREWAALNARILAGQRPVARHLADGWDRGKDAYVLDWMDTVATGRAFLAVQVNGSLHATQEPMDVVYEALSLLPGTVIAGGSGPWFTATLYIPAESDIALIHDAVVQAFAEIGTDAAVAEVRRVDLAVLREAIEPAAGITVSDLDVIATAFFSEHGFDARRLTLLGGTCAFPDLGHTCRGKFWSDVHAAYHYGHIATPYSGADTTQET